MISHLWGGQERVLIALVFLVCPAPQELLGSQVMMFVRILRWKSLKRQIRDTRIIIIIQF